ncbi:RHS repeat-associated core domain-containing protein [Pseudomonas avellanae]|uniref:RHS repeat-associated core domain-containing protein n=1 Tax=Pseudomonas avellanae TaxID=46257 RepID=UPI0009B11F60|nr:RHS repeat-associated core domain-containing protein [Pseudomonas avellanae]
MSSANPVVLCTYHYDATDRLADCAPAGQDSTRLFYQKSRLATQIQGQIQHTLLRTDEYLLARLSVENNQSNCALLATDQQQSVIAAQSLAFAYTPYGHHQPSTGPMNLPGFTGERVDPVTGHYLLGNGYRAFNPVLMRFNSPDSLSPFGEGGLNAYGYCEGDPVNRVDPSGHLPKFLLRFFKKRSGVKQPLLDRSVSQESVSSVASFSPVEASNSGASGVVTHGSNSTYNLPSGGPPPISPKSGLSSDVPPPIPSKKGQPSNVPPPIPPRGNYLRIEGRKVYIREAEKQFDELVLAKKSYTSKGNVVPYVVENNLEFYRRAVEYIRGGNGALRKPASAPTRFR